MNELIAYHRIKKAGVDRKHELLTPAALTRLVRSSIKIPKILIITAKDETVDIDEIYVTCKYDPEADMEQEPSITVTLAYSPQQQTICVADLSWEEICITIIETIGHEMVHQMQHRERQYDGPEVIFCSGNKNLHTRAVQDLLGQEDEIEAHGFSIAVAAYLRGTVVEISGPVVIKDYKFQQYVTIFGPYHPVVLGLFEYIISYHAAMRGDFLTDQPDLIEHLLKLSPK